jgi:DNA-directed RNA polymerase subunit F
MREAEHDSVKSVFELREAAVEHGKAIAQLDRSDTRQARDDVLATKLELEEKTVAAIDDCAENAENAAEQASA